MEQLFRLYRVLANCGDNQNEKDPYQQALDWLESLLITIDELKRWEEHYGSDLAVDEDRASQLADIIKDRFKSALCEHDLAHIDVVAAMMDFVDTHLPDDELDKLIDSLNTYKAKREEQIKKRKERDDLGDLDEHLF